tara:strand:- start:144 stop:248 length:105 start_codon:yes stop_codon:yes gene_type:complete
MEELEAEMTSDSDKELDKNYCKDPVYAIELVEQK